MIKAIIKDNNQIISNLQELELLIDKLLQVEYQDFSFEGHGTTSLLVLTNQKKVFMLFLRFNGDDGYVSKNNIDTYGSESFILNNGQRDEYPSNWTISKNQAKKVICHYFTFGTMDSSIDWDIG